VSKHRICTAIPVPQSARLHLSVKRQEAIELLRERGKYLLDQRCKNWSPRSKDETDVMLTVRECFQEAAALRASMYVAGLPVPALLQPQAG